MIGDVNLFLSLSQTDIEESEISNPNPIANPPSLDPNTFPLVTAELELMIPSPPLQHQGRGRAALLIFMTYILTHESEIMHEFLASHLNHSSPRSPYILSQSPTTSTTTPPSDPTARLCLTAKISTANTPSLALFESLGFEKTSAEASYFGEFELRLASAGIGMGVSVALRRVQEMMAERGIEDYREMRYG